MNNPTLLKNLRNIPELPYTRSSVQGRDDTFKNAKVHEDYAKRIV